MNIPTPTNSLHIIDTTGPGGAETLFIDIAEHLTHKKIGQLIVVEPNIKSLPKNLAKAGVQLSNLESALEAANVVVILVDHKEFKTADKALFTTKVVIDTRGVL